MICQSYDLMTNDVCNEVNNRLECNYDGGNCYVHDCSDVKCHEEKLFDPCPSFHRISDGQCDKENYNFICSFDGGDCQSRYMNFFLETNLDDLY